MTLAELLQASPALFTGLIFAFSLLVGSFLNVVIHRLPVMMDREWREQCAELTAGESGAADGKTGDTQRTLRPRYNLVVPRSACPHCHAPIRAWQNIPVVSYVFLRGKCASCGARISPRYPIVELLTALLSAIVAWHFGFGWQAVAALVFTWMLIALAAIDLDTSYLFDNLTLPLLWLGLLVSLAWQGDAGSSFPVDPRSSIIGAVAGYLSLWSVYHAFRLLTGKEGMGYGDFKLFAAFGAWFGWQMLPLIILLSAFTGALVGIYLMIVRRHGRDVPIPFGPYLAAAGWIALIWGPDLVQRYLNMSGLRGA
jgi:leader peptidase (prepilin peptidase) / N-methyltransferase